MPKMEWDGSLSIGVEMIDGQHRMLISKLSDLSDAVDQHREAAVLMQTVQFLREYTDFHFKEEEQEMEKANYPHIEEHKKLHKEFIGMIGTLEEDLQEEGATRAVGESVNTFLWNWLYDHIMKTDMKLGSYLNKS